MVHKQTKLKIIDINGLLYGRVFHVFTKKKFLKNHGYSYFSICETYLRAIKFLGQKKYNYIMRTNKCKRRKDNTYVDFWKNSSVIVKKRAAIKGGFSKGPAPRLLKKKKLLLAFSTII